MLNKIRSKFILNCVFGMIKKIKKLSLMKYNKKLQFISSVTKQDYEEYKLLKDFRLELDLDIYGVDIEKLDLRKKISQNDKLNWLIKINFKDLKELNLSNNKISDISVLEKANFKKLKYLNLNLDEITDINILKKIEFTLLSKLYLYHNQITINSILSTLCNYHNPLIR